MLASLSPLKLQLLQGVQLLQVMSPQNMLLDVEMLQRNNVLRALPTCSSSNSSSNSNRSSSNSSSRSRSSNSNSSSRSSRSSSSSSSSSNRSLALNNGPSVAKSRRT
jgi:hypothetical protein